MKLFERRTISRRTWRSVVIAGSVAILFGLGSEGSARADGSVGLWPDLRASPHGGAARTMTTPSPDAALVIGVDKYDALPRVEGAAENARDWEAYFLSSRMVPPQRVRMLTDQAATAESIRGAARMLSEQIEPGGTLFVVFIGHGAPGAGGEKSVLLGSDVRPSDTSFASRSVSHDQILGDVAAGKQARTVLVLDACFSGVGRDGKLLIEGVQPVVPASLVETPRTTIFSASRSAEYAGALPGSQRPALSYLLLGALRGWADADADGKVTPAEANAYVGSVLEALPKNHEQHPQLSSDEPNVPLAPSEGARPPDLVELRRKLAGWRPAVEKKEADLAVSVTCRGKPVSERSGLEVFVNDTRLVASESASYVVKPSVAAVTVKAPGCKAFTSESVDLKVGTPVSIEGALESDRSGLERLPFGEPGLFQVSLEGAGHYFTINDVSSWHGSVVGPRLALGLAGRHVDAGLAFEGAAASLMSEGNHHAWSPFLLMPSASLGFRLPFGSVLLRPLSARASVVIFSGSDGANLPTNVKPHAIPRTALALGTGADVALSCDFSIRLSAELGPSLSDSASIVGGALGVVYAPSSTCHDERRIPEGIRVGGTLPPSL